VIKIKEEIVFVSSLANIREYKHALALKKTKRYHLKLIAFQTIPIFDFENVFDEVKIYGPKMSNKIFRLGFNILHQHFGSYYAKKLAKIIRKEKPYMFHTFASYDNEMSHVVMKNTTLPVIYDGQDFLGISVGIENISKSQKTKEKFCLEHANGIVRKGSKFEIDYYRQHGYNIRCPELQFLPYCDRDLFVNEKTKLSSKDGEIHVVYTGAVSPDPKYRYIYYIPLGELLAKQKIHLHLYPAIYRPRLFKEYLEMNKTEKYFHFHKPVPYNKINKEIAKYDWGVWILENIRSKQWTKEKMKIAVANKIFSYLEAGLPVIQSEHVYGKEMIEKYKIGFCIKDEELKNLKLMIESYNYEKIRKNVLKAREELSLDKQVHKLENFYKIVVSKCK